MMNASWWARTVSTWRCIWALYVLAKTSVKIEWWLLRRHDLGIHDPEFETKARAAQRAINELFSRDVGEFGSPQRQAFIATLDAIQATLIALGNYHQKVGNSGGRRRK